MSKLGILGIGGHFSPGRAATGTEYLAGQHPLRRILAFRGRSIDDIVNDPVVKNEVIGYFKLHRHINRAGETRELERQWNSVG